MFPSVDELQRKFAEARYIVDEDTIRRVYLAGVMQKSPAIVFAHVLGPRPALAGNFANSGAVRRAENIDKML